MVSHLFNHIIKHFDFCSSWCLKPLSLIFLLYKKCFCKLCWLFSVHNKHQHYKITHPGGLNSPQYILLCLDSRQTWYLLWYGCLAPSALSYRGCLATGGSQTPSRRPPPPLWRCTARCEWVSVTTPWPLPVSGPAVSSGLEVISSQINPLSAYGLRLDTEGGLACLWSISLPAQAGSRRHRPSTDLRNYDEMFSFLFSLAEST